MSDDVLQIPLPILARVLARLYESNASATMKGCAAMVTVDVWDALKAEGIAPADSLAYWQPIDAARTVERAKWEALLADFQARRAS
jgi:hypothetical protein